MPSIKVPMQQLEAEIVLREGGGDGRERRKTVMFYSGATVGRGSYEPYKLTLSMNPRHVRMQRLESGKAPVLDSHSDYRLKDVIGVVESARITDGRGYADLRFSDRPEVLPIWSDIKSGIIRNASVGARIHQLKDVTGEDDKVKSYLAVDWEPLEISIVPIGADMEAGFRASDERFTEAEIVFAEDNQRAEEARAMEARMPEETKNAAGSDTRADEQQQTSPQTLAELAEQERLRVRDLGATTENARVTSIIETCKACGLEFQFCERYIKNGASIDEFRRLAIDERARRIATQPEVKGPSGVQIELRREEQDMRRKGMAGALLNRFEPGKFRFDDETNDFVFCREGGQKLFEASRQFVSLSLLDVAKECLAAMGIRWQTKNRTEIASLAFQSTSDFPNILASVANKTLRAGYEMADSQWKLIAARRTAPDFKTNSELTLDGSARLEKVPESGEFKRGKLVEGKETWVLSTYGKIISLTRQAIVNDDLGAFTRTPFLLGQEVAMLEADTVIGIITGNGNLADGVALFEASTHKNLVASGAAISVDAIGAVRVLMQLQKSPGGKTLGIVPRYLLAPATKGQLAMQYCSANFQAVESSKINPWAGLLTPIVEPRLDATDTNDWYLFADPQSPNGTVLIYGYLEGQEGPYTENRQGFDVDGVELKIRHDFGAAAVDYRGAAKQTGA